MLAPTMLARPMLAIPMLARRGRRGGVRAAVLLAAVPLSLLTGLGVLPAAADSETTEGTVVVSGGALRITAPGDAGVLGTRSFDKSSGTVSGSLGSVKVSDTRGAAPGSGWVASVVASSLEGPGKSVIPAGTVSYSVGKITKVGRATYRAHNPDDISELTKVVTATGITGNNTARWNPTIAVRVPGGTRAGTYTITVTHSVI